MDKKRVIVKHLKLFKKNLSMKFRINKIIFFGSMAFGKSHRHSDIDLIIVSSDFNGKRFRYRPIGFYNY